MRRQMKTVQLNVSRGGTQTSLQLSQGGHRGKRVRALLDTGSSRMIVRASALPEPCAFDPQYDCYIHFLAARRPARVVRMRATILLSDTPMTDDDAELQLAVVTRAELPNGVDAVLGMCDPAIPAHPSASFTRAIGVREFTFRFQLRGGSSVLELHSPRRDDAQPLLDARTLLMLDPTASNLHFGLSTDQISRVVFDTGSSVSIVPRHGLALMLGPRRVSLDSALLWSEAGGGVGVVLGMDALRTTGTIHLQRIAEWEWAMAVGEAS